MILKLTEMEDQHLSMFHSEHARILEYFVSFQERACQELEVLQYLDSKLSPRIAGPSFSSQQDLLLSPCVLSAIDSNYRILMHIIVRSQ